MSACRVRAGAKVPVLGVLACGVGGRAPGGPHRRANGDGRGIPRRRRSRARLRPGAGGRGGRPGRGPRIDEPHLLAGRRGLQGRRQGGERPAQARRTHGRAARAGAGVSRALRRSTLAWRRTTLRAAAARRWRGNDGDTCRAHRRGAEAPSSRQGRPPPPRPGARYRPAQARSRRRERVDLVRGDLRTGRRRPRTLARGAAAYGGSRRRAPPCVGRGSADRDGEAPLRRFLDPQPLTDGARGDRRRGAHRRARLLLARPRAARSARRASPCRSRRLGPYRQLALV
jgi:hypothetical protein